MKNVVIIILSAMVVGLVCAGGPTRDSTFVKSAFYVPPTAWENDPWLTVFYSNSIGGWQGIVRCDTNIHYIRGGDSVMMLYESNTPSRSLVQFTNTSDLLPVPIENPIKVRTFYMLQK